MLTSSLKRSKNNFRAIGRLYENGLKREACDIKLRDENGKPNGTTKGERIMGRIAVKTDKGICTFDVYFQNLTTKGEENKMWKMATEMLDWVPQVGGNGEPTMVNIEGSVAINDYIGRDGEVKSGLRWNVRNGNTRVNDGDTCGTSLNAVCYIDSIVPEVRNEEETGRLKVRLIAVGGNGDVFPIDALVAEDMADDFESVCEVGQTVNFDMDLVVRHVGGVKLQKKAFGHNSSVTVNSGFDVQELMIVGADDPIEPIEDKDGEVTNGWLNPDVIKKAKRERAKMLEELKNNPPKKGEQVNPRASVKASVSAAKKQYSKPVVDDFDDEDSGDNKSSFDEFENIF